MKLALQLLAMLCVAILHPVLALSLALGWLFMIRVGEAFKPKPRPKPAPETIEVRAQRLVREMQGYLKA